MWTGSSGPYRHSTQNAQGTHATWSATGARPAGTPGTPGVPSTPAIPGTPGGPGTPGAAGASGTAGSSAYHPQQSQQSQQPQQAAKSPASNADGIPEPPKSFPELEAMPLKDLRVLHEEKAKFEDFVSKHQHQKVVDEFVARIRGNVEKFEREHEAVTAKIGEVVNENQLAEMRQQIKDMEEEVQGLQVLKDEWLEHNSPERLIERLRIAMRESESLSESLEKSMLSSSMNFDEFLAQYIACRKKYHERCLKLEELKKQAKIRSLAR